MVSTLARIYYKTFKKLFSKTMKKVEQKNTTITYQELFAAADVEGCLL